MRVTVVDYKITWASNFRTELNCMHCSIEAMVAAVMLYTEQ